MYKYNVTMDVDLQSVCDSARQEEKARKEAIIDLSALASKASIEHGTKLPPVAKFAINFAIDQVAERLKSDLLSVSEKICRDAKIFNIDKVIAIPYNNDMFVMRVYGQNPDKFIKHIGFQVISENKNNTLVRAILKKEQDFSTLIYQKKDCKLKGGLL